LAILILQCVMFHAHKQYSHGCYKGLTYTVKLIMLTLALIKRLGPVALLTYGTSWATKTMAHMLTSLQNASFHENVNLLHVVLIMFSFIMTMSGTSITEAFLHRNNTCCDLHKALKRIGKIFLITKQIMWNHQNASHMHVANR
jgi:hypothetical protein